MTRFYKLNAWWCLKRHLRKKSIHMTLKLGAYKVIREMLTNTKTSFISLQSSCYESLCRTHDSPACEVDFRFQNNLTKLGQSRKALQYRGARIQSGGYILAFSQRLALRLRRSAWIGYIVDKLWKQFGWAIHVPILQGHVLEQSPSPCRLGQLQVEALRIGTPWQLWAQLLRSMAKA